MRLRGRRRSIRQEPHRDGKRGSNHSQHTVCIARQNVWPAPYCGRVLQNDFSEKWRGREADLLQHQEEESARYAAARAAGDFDTAAVIAGEVVDLIADIPTAAEIIERMIRGATHLFAGVSNKYKIFQDP